MLAAGLPPDLSEKPTDFVDICSCPLPEDVGRMMSVSCMAKDGRSGSCKWNKYLCLSGTERHSHSAMSAIWEPARMPRGRRVVYSILGSHWGEKCSMDCTSLSETGAHCSLMDAVQPSSPPSSLPRPPCKPDPRRQAALKYHPASNATSTLPLPGTRTSASPLATQTGATLPTPTRLHRSSSPAALILFHHLHNPYACRMP